MAFKTVEGLHPPHHIKLHRPPTVAGPNGGIIQVIQEDASTLTATGYRQKYFARANSKDRAPRERRIVRRGPLYAMSINKYTMLCKTIHQPLDLAL